MSPLYTEASKVARQISLLLQADSGIPIDESWDKLHTALLQDCTSIEDLPARAEWIALVVGDETGSPPRELCARFPHLNIALEEFF